MPALHLQIILQGCCIGLRYVLKIKYVIRKYIFCLKDAKVWQHYCSKHLFYNLKC